jgi:hypothetical protein
MNGAAARESEKEEDAVDEMEEHEMHEGEDEDSLLRVACAVEGVCWEHRGRAGTGSGGEGEGTLQRSRYTREEGGVVRVRGAQTGEKSTASIAKPCTMRHAPTPTSGPASAPRVRAGGPAAVRNSRRSPPRGGAEMTRTVLPMQWMGGRRPIIVCRTPRWTVCAGTGGAGGRGADG